MHDLTVVSTILTPSSTSDEPSTDTTRTNVGHATDAWQRLSRMMAKQDLDGIEDLYAVDALYLEPYNPPHRGNLLIHAYLKDYFAGKDDVQIDVVRIVEAADSSTLAVEWTISYTAAGRRWNALPRASFMTFDDAGRIEHHRDYS